MAALAARAWMVVVVALACAAPAAAAPGDLDAGFGVGGVARLNVSSDLRRGAAHSVAVQPDGRIVAAGWGNSEGALMRILADGSLDPSFGRGGRLILPWYLDIVGVALQSDGHIVAVGRSSGSPRAVFLLLRVSPDGRLDPSFGDGGLVSTPFASGEAYANAVAVQADDAIVVAGQWSATTTSSRFAAARYTPDGVLDTGFGIGGLATVAGSAGSDFASALAVRSDGGVVLAGSTTGAAGRAFGVARLTASGTPAADFGAGGSVALDLSSFDDDAVAVAAYPDGRIAVGGGTVVGGQQAFALARLLGDGTLDPAFGQGGIAHAAVGGTPTGLVRQADGGLALCGHSSDGGPLRLTAVRFTAGGILDASFDGDGIVTTPIGSSHALAWALVAQLDGRLVAAGEARTRTLFDDAYDFALVRYDVDGGLDASFGAAGIVTTGVGGSFDTAFALAVQPDGAIVAAGSREVGGLTDFALGRFRADGTADPTFGDGGVTALSHDSYWDEIRGVVVQPDGRIVVAGVAGTADVFGSPGPNQFLLARHLADGMPDASFGDAGVVRTLVGGVDAGAHALLRQADGRLVAAGYAWDGAGTRIALARYLADGTLDATFGVGGTVLTAVGTSAEAWALAVQPDGKLVAAGRSQVGEWRATVVRYLPDGVLDDTFGAGGVAAVDWPLVRDTEAYALAVGAGGRLTLAGRALQFAGHWDFAVAQLAADGSPDAAFGDGGLVTTDLGHLDERAHAVAVLPSGRVAVGGASWASPDQMMALLLYEADGGAVAAHSFALGGVFGLRFDETRALLVQPDGRLVAGGTSNGDLALVRHRGEYRGCPPTPGSCRAAGRSSLSMTDAVVDARDRLIWKWSRGAATDAAVIGDPTATASYAVCVYAGAAGALAGQAVIAPGGGWRPLGDAGFSYRDPHALRDGVAKVVLKGGAAGRAKLLVKGMGAALPDLPLPTALPLSIQLVDLQTDTCWGAQFAPADVIRNDSGGVRARHR